MLLKEGKEVVALILLKGERVLNLQTVPVEEAAEFKRAQSTQGIIAIEVPEITLQDILNPERTESVPHGGWGKCVQIKLKGERSARPACYNTVQKMEYTDEGNGNQIGWLRITLATGHVVELSPALVEDIRKETPKVNEGSRFFLGQGIMQRGGRGR